MPPIPPPLPTSHSWAFWRSPTQVGGGGGRGTSHRSPSWLAGMGDGEFQQPPQIFARNSYCWCVLTSVLGLPLFPLAVPQEMGGSSFCTHGQYWGARDTEEGDHCSPYLPPASQVPALTVLHQGLWDSHSLGQCWGATFWGSSWHPRGILSTARGSSAPAAEPQGVATMMQCMCMRQGAKLGLPWVLLNYGRPKSAPAGLRDPHLMEGPLVTCHFQRKSFLSRSHTLSTSNT